MAHRYWRLYVWLTNGSAITSLKELEFRATLGGADQTGAGTPMSSSDFGGAFVKANAFDNGPAEWASSTGAGLPAWIGYDFGAGVNVQQISVTIRSTDPANDVLQAPKSFSVDYSDDAITWTAYFAEAGITSWVDGGTKLFQIPAGLEATKALTYVPIGPPLLLSCTKAVMYVVTGPPRQQFKVRLLKSIPLGVNR